MKGGGEDRRRGRRGDGGERDGGLGGGVDAVEMDLEGVFEE